MNREILFRAWYKTKKKMVFFPDLNSCWIASNGIIGIDTDLKSDTYIEHENEWWKNMSPLMQYTGLKDKNGKEIYEGDIIEKYHCDIKSFGELKTDGMQWWIEDKLNETHWENMDITSGKFCEIISNIYENSDLLTP